MLNSVFQSNSTLGSNTCWAPIALPYSASQQYNRLTFIDSGGIRYPAVKHRDIGIQSCLWYVRGTWPNANTTVSGYFVEPTGPDVTNFNGSGLSSFTVTNYLLDRPLDIIPKVTYGFNGVSTTHWVGQSSEGLGRSLACQEFHVVEHGASGMMTNIWLDIMAQQDVVPFKLMGTWSDPANSSWGPITVDSIVIQSRCPFVIHWASEKGISNPVYNATTKLYTTTILTSQTFIDGQSYEVEGALLCVPYAYNWTVDSTIPLSRNSTLSAFYLGSSTYGGVGEVNGMCKELNVNGDWDVWGRIPETPTSPNVYWQATNYNRSPFSVTGMYGLRNYGNLKDPGSAGDQEDFGQTKGYLATVSGDPTWILLMKGGGLTHAYRPVSHYDTNGKMATYSNHPGAMCYKSQIWGQPGYGITDYLGKTAGTNPGDGGAGTTWKFISEQHMSRNNLCTYYAITGDRLAEQILKHFTENELWMVPGLQYNPGAYTSDSTQRYATADNGRWTAEREIGRNLLAACRAYKLMNEVYRPKILSFITSRLNHYYNYIWRGRLVSPEKQWMTADSLFFKTASTYVSATNGDDRVWAWHPFESTILAFGMYACYKITGDPSALRIAQNKCKMAVSAGIYSATDGSFHSPVFLRYRTGYSIPEIALSAGVSAPLEGTMLDTSAYLPVSPWTTYFSDAKSYEVVYMDESIKEWVYPACVLAYTICPETEIQTRALAAIDYYYPGRKPNRWRDSEWCVAAPFPT